MAQAVQAQTDIVQAMLQRQHLCEQLPSVDAVSTLAGTTLFHVTRTNGTQVVVTMQADGQPVTSCTPGPQVTDPNYCVMLTTIYSTYFRTAPPCRPAAAAQGR